MIFLFIQDPGQPSQPDNDLLVVKASGQPSGEDFYYLELEEVIDQASNTGLQFRGTIGSLDVSC